MFKSLDSFINRKHCHDVFVVFFIIIYKPKSLVSLVQLIFRFRIEIGRVNPTMKRREIKERRNNSELL